MTGKLTRLLEKSAAAAVMILLFITVFIVCTFFAIYINYYYPVEFRYDHIHPGIWLLALVCGTMLYELILKQVHELEASGKRRRITNEPFFKMALLGVAVGVSMSLLFAYGCYRLKQEPARQEKALVERLNFTGKMVLFSHKQMVLLLPNGVEVWRRTFPLRKAEAEVKGRDCWTVDFRENHLVREVRLKEHFDRETPECKALAEEIRRAPASPPDLAQSDGKGMDFGRTVAWAAIVLIASLYFYRALPPRKRSRSSPYTQGDDLPRPPANPKCQT